MKYYGIKVRPDGRHQVFVTEDGRDLTLIPRAVFPKPRQAVNYANKAQKQALSESELRLLDGNR